MLKTKFEAQQYLIRQAEIKLHNDTQMLLTEMLRSLSEENLLLLNYFCLDGGEEHFSYIKNIEINSNSITIIVENNYDDSILRYDIDNLSQPSQKDLIDFILENNLVKNS
jgi:hypothetical protein